MRYHSISLGRQRISATSLVLSTLLLLLLAACGGGNSTPTATTPALASKQVLTMPNVGTQEIGVLDPAQGPDANSAIAVGMIYTGLLKFDKHLNVVPDQATWNVSPDNKTYTFHLKAGITFSDGTPVTAQAYVYTLTRALLPEVKSGIAGLFEGTIVGANDVANGKTRILSGVKAIDDSTLQITLAAPTAYFLEAVANSIYFPLNKSLIDQYGQTNWVNHAAGGALGTGPFMVKEWIHSVKMVLVPNPHYYGTQTKLTEVDMIFVQNPHTAFQSYQAGQYNFVWNLPASALAAAKGMPGFTSVSLLQTDLLFFSNKMKPFNQSAVRQAFAYAIDKATLAHVIFKDAAVAAPTIIPPGMPGYQPKYQGLAFDKAKALAALQSVYPDATKMPSVTFSFPSGQVTSQEAEALQQMWQDALGIHVSLDPVELNAYNAETTAHQIQFGFTQWSDDFPDPYDFLTLNLTSSAPNNSGQWSNPTFDTLTTQAEQTTGTARIALYNQAEQVVISDVGWLPLDHQALAAVIPPSVHGVSLNGSGLFFGDWSDVYLLQH